MDNNINPDMEPKTPLQAAYESHVEQTYECYER